MAWKPHSYPIHSSPGLCYNAWMWSVECIWLRYGHSRGLWRLAGTAHSTFYGFPLNRIWVMSLALEWVSISAHNGLLKSFKLRLWSSSLTVRSSYTLIDSRPIKANESLTPVQKPFILLYKSSFSHYLCLRRTMYFRMVICSNAKLPSGGMYVIFSP